MFFLSSSNGKEAQDARWACTLAGPVAAG